MTGPDTDSIPFWVKVTCAPGDRAGHLPRWLADHPHPRQGSGRDLPAAGDGGRVGSAAVILSSSHLGFALSTTHVATGSILGSGVGRGAPVRWKVAGRMVIAWAITLPVGRSRRGTDVVHRRQHRRGVGAIVISAILVAFSLLMWVRARRAPIGAHNVNDDWDGIPGTSRSASGADPRLPPPPTTRFAEGDCDEHLDPRRRGAPSGSS